MAPIDPGLLGAVGSNPPVDGDMEDVPLPPLPRIDDET